MEEKMANKKILLGMLVIALVFGMTVIGCDDNSSEDGNSYKGEWNGTFTPKDGDVAEATITFSDDTWTLTARTINLTGTYTIGTFQATLSVDSSAGSVPVATASIVLSNLQVAFNAGTHNGSTGSFTRVRPPSDSFKGSWNGSFTPTDGTAIDNATVAFTDDAWTLTAGAISLNGSYVKTGLGLAVDLNVAVPEFGTFKIGSGVLNPVTGNLTVTITGSDHKGRGSFTRAP
jgi:hypothetical protein